MLTETKFHDFMSALQNQLTYLNQLTKCFQEILPNDYVSGIDIRLIDYYIKLLAVVMNDETELIYYFVWELDFGAKWKPGCITDNGKDIKLQTIQDLWIALN